MKLPYWNKSDKAPEEPLRTITLKGPVGGPWFADSNDDVEVNVSRKNGTETSRGKVVSFGYNESTKDNRFLVLVPIDGENEKVGTKFCKKEDLLRLNPDLEFKLELKGTAENQRIDSKVENQRIDSSGQVNDLLKGDDGMERD